MDHFQVAPSHATTDAQHAPAAMALAKHVGVHAHDAPAALAIIAQTLERVQDPVEAGHLKRDAAKWAVVAGQAATMVPVPVESTDAKTALGLLTVAMSGAIAGPLSDADRALARLRRLPRASVDLVPGGLALMALAEIMALSNSGDIVSTQRRLEGHLREAELTSPEMLGAWQYALGFLELFSGSMERAYELAVAASRHLHCRDETGLRPAAQALVGATTAVLSRTEESGLAFGSIPSTANQDPKVVMLRAWAQAWRPDGEGSPVGAASLLLENDRWLLAAQHTYFAGMLAHRAVQLGAAADGQLVEAQEVLRSAQEVGGGGLLGLFVRHCAAVSDNDSAALESIGREAQALGLKATAAHVSLLGRRY